MVSKQLKVTKRQEADLKRLETQASALEALENTLNYFALVIEDAETTANIVSLQETLIEKHQIVHGKYLDKYDRIYGTDGVESRKRETNNV